MFKHVDTEFLDTYGSVGYYLRQLDINTPSRIAMLSSLVHLLRSEEQVEFDTFYEYSLDQTGEKLEKSSFKTLIRKLKKATGIDDPVKVDDDTGKYYCADILMEQLQKAKQEFEKLTGNLT